MYALTLNNLDGMRAERASAYSSIVVSNIEIEIEVLLLLFMRASHTLFGAWPRWLWRKVIKVNDKLKEMFVASSSSSH